MLRRVITELTPLFKPYQFGFVEGHHYLSNTQWSQIDALVGKENLELTHLFESAFAHLIGNGETVSFASARMGFYTLMRHLNISAGDEVIVTGFTCAVMINAILKTGARPIYSDVDPETYGTCPKSAKKHLSPKTKMIVAQHSFGIPCKIEELKDLTKEIDVFLLEDCALSLTSKYKGVTLGNFGDAAIFSIDHSKPLNAFSGGLIYTNNTILIKALRDQAKFIPHLPIIKQKMMLAQAKLEARLSSAKATKWRHFSNLVSSVKKKFCKTTSPFLDCDFSTRTDSYGEYPYPALLPSFLSQLGLFAIDHWQKKADERKYIQQKLLKLLVESGRSSSLPKAYIEEDYDVCALRIAWHEIQSKKTKSTLSIFIQTNWIWFQNPIIATGQSLEDFGYHAGMCPNSEEIGPQMINLPVHVKAHDLNLYLSLLKKAFPSNKASQLDNPVNIEISK